jgi:peptide/nickel transport system substrate-binding protein
MTWTVNIDPNAVWADGTALTAYDVNYSYNLLIDPTLPSWHYSYWSQYIDSDSINIISDYEFEMVFSQPYAFQENNLAADLLPRHIWNTTNPANHGSQAAIWALSDPNKLMGAGPYYLENYDDINSIIHLKANPYFDDWSGITPNFDDIYFEFYSNKEGVLLELANGALDMVDAHFSPQFSDIAGLAGVTYELVDDPGAQEMGINMEHKFLGTGDSCPIAGKASANHIRKAISHMVPRKTIVNEIRDGIGREGVTAWCPATHGFDESLEPYTYNVTLAKIHMRSAGFEFPEDNIPTNPPRTIILGFTLKSIACTAVIVWSFIVIIHYKKKRK